MKSKVVIIGASGHAKVIIDILKDSKEFEIQGCTDINPAKRALLGYPILGDDSILPSLFSTGTRYAFVALGDNKVRHKIAKYVQELGFELINVISPFSYISSSAKLGRGVVVMPGVIINAHSIVGNNVIINTSATIDHDCMIEDSSHIAPGCNIAGSVRVKQGAFLGVGCRAIPNVVVGSWTIVGAGSVITRDLPGNSTVVGIPAKVIKFN